MKLLLDTHALLWLLDGNPRISDRAREFYENARQPLFSMVSLWEIGIKLGLQRSDFELDSSWWLEIPRTLVAQGAARVDVEPLDCRNVSTLPLHHRDPFDRMLIVQAARLECPILSIDTKFDRYEIQRLW